MEGFDRRGAEAKVNFGTLYGRSVVIKEREPKKYRIEELDTFLRQSRTRAEARAMIAASRAGASVPQLLCATRFSLIMEKCPGILLKDTKVSASTYKEIGAALAAIHSAEVAHGDFTPANILVNRGKPIVIDFGLAVFSKDSEELAIDLLLMKRSVGENFKHVLSGYKAFKGWKKVNSRMIKIDSRGRYKNRKLEEND